MFCTVSILGAALPAPEGFRESLHDGACILSGFGIQALPNSRHLQRARAHGAEKPFRLLRLFISAPNDLTPCGRVTTRAPAGSRQLSRTNSMQGARHDARMPHKTVVLCPSRDMACVRRMVFCGRRGEHPFGTRSIDRAQNNLRAANLPVFNLPRDKLASCADTSPKATCGANLSSFIGSPSLRETCSPATISRRQR